MQKEGIMPPMTIVTWVRKFHRVTGLALIVVVALKILSGYAVTGRVRIWDSEGGSLIHLSKWIDAPLLFLFTFHSLYGIYKMLQPHVMNKALLFWILNAIGSVLFIGAIVGIYLL
jgi:succinate dehydrogenase/fumarate reductase cytochrome b subunit